MIRNGSNFGSPGVDPIILVTLSGNYSVKVSFGGCVTTSNVLAVTFKKIPVASAGLDLKACASLVQNLNVAGVTTLGGIWSGSSRVTTAGDYNSAGFIGCDTLTFQVDSLGCSGFDTKVVCLDSVPVVNVASLDASACLTSDGSAWGATSLLVSIYGL